MLLNYGSASAAKSNCRAGVGRRMQAAQATTAAAAGAVRGRGRRPRGAVLTGVFSRVAADYTGRRCGRRARCPGQRHERQPRAPGRRMEACRSRSARPRMRKSAASRSCWQWTKTQIVQQEKNHRRDSGPARRATTIEFHLQPLHRVRAVRLDERRAVGPLPFDAAASHGGGAGGARAARIRAAGNPAGDHPQRLLGRAERQFRWRRAPPAPTTAKA